MQQEEKRLQHKKEQDEQRRRHENALTQTQLELERVRREKERKNRLADKIEAWKDTDQPGLHDEIRPRSHRQSGRNG